MPRIETDPRLEILPDHSSPDYQDLRTILINTGLTEAQALEQLNTTWTRGHDTRVQGWDHQLEEDARDEEERQQAILEQEEAVRLQREREEEAEKQEADKKKPKINDFDEDAMIDDFLMPRPSSYALRRLEDFEYVELYYFTQEGCIDALENQHTLSEDTFGITKQDNMVQLRSISSLKASKHVIQDSELSWRQMTMGKTTLLANMPNANWPAKHVNALTQFFLQLEMHPFRSRPHGERILILYQARARRDWHDKLKLKQAFNIAHINAGLLRSISDEVWDHVRSVEVKEVSRFHRLVFFFRLANNLVSLSLHLFSHPLHTILLHAQRTSHNAQCTTCNLSPPCTMHNAQPLPLHHVSRALHHTSLRLAQNNTRESSRAY
jgi:hypothetical protein